MVHPNRATVHGSDEASSRVAAATHRGARPDFTDADASAQAIAAASSRLVSLVEGRPFWSELDLNAGIRPHLLLSLIRVMPELVRVVSHKAVVLMVAPITGLAPDLSPGAAAACMPASVVSLINMLLRLKELRPELTVSFLLRRVERLLFRRFEVFLLVFVVVLMLLIRPDNALQLLRVVMVHADVVDRRLVLLVNVLHVDRILDAAIANLRACFGPGLARALRPLAAAEVSALVLEAGVVLRELLLWSKVSLLRVDVMEHS